MPHIYTAVKTENYQPLLNNWNQVMFEPLKYLNFSLLQNKSKFENNDKIEEVNI